MCIDKIAYAFYNDASCCVAMLEKLEKILKKTLNVTRIESLLVLDSGRK